MSHCVIVMAKHRQPITLKDVHENLEQNAHLKVMASHTVKIQAYSVCWATCFECQPTIISDTTEKHQEKGDFKKKTVPSNIIKWGLSFSIHQSFNDIAILSFPLTISVSG